MSKQDRPRQDHTSGQPSHLPNSVPPPVKVKVLVSQKPPRRASDPPPNKSPSDSSNASGVRVLVSSRGHRKASKTKVDTASSPPPSRSSDIKILVSSEPPPPSFPELEEWEDDGDETDQAPIRILASSEPRPTHPAIAALGFTASWLGIAALVAGGGWLAVQLIINPGSISWMQWMFPESSRGAFLEENAPRSLSQIRAQAKAAGLYLGQPFPLADSGDLIIPVSDQMSPCSGLEATPTASCGEISELHVYRPFTAAPLREVKYELVDRLAMPGLDEYFVVAPLTGTTGDEGSSRRLRMTTVSAISGSAPETGIWFQVSGERTRGNTRILYGQVMGYDPGKGRLETRLQWTSPAAELPRWRDVVAGGTPELVVNQTVGLEPSFQLHQIQTTSTTLELKTVDLTKPALNNATFKNGLVLAQSGLWSPALSSLEQVKDRSQGAAPGWSATAQAQFDLIRLHAEFTQAQAKRVWANPSEQITALLIDGQWATALQQFRNALKDGHDLTPLLRDDAQTIWKRVKAAIQVNRRQYDVQAWGALTIATKQGRRAAIAWLQSLQPPSQNPNTVDPRLQDILTLLNQIPRSDLPAQQSNNFLGFATPISSITPREWVIPEPDTALEPGEQQWYRVQITRFHNGQRWWRSPFTNLNLPALGIANQLWEDLGLASNPTFQIAFWSTEGQFQTLSVSAKAIRFNNGTLQVLALGDKLPDTTSRAAQPLVMTTDNLQWVEPSYAMTLTDFSYQQPDWMPILLPKTWQILQEAGYVTTTKMPTQEEMLQAMGVWSMQLIDLTDNEQPEMVLTVQPTFLASSTYVEASATNALQTAPSYTLVFSDQGDVIYNDVGDREATLLAIATLIDDPLPMLIVDAEPRYEIKQWSPQNRRFQ
ncbi:hypothetical protein H6G89_11145 [Oscillatoria sp. FACHB-1407]|uniref:hypothetical protein n=1 Tax=Oscillatoria sp. FACHB-1407 TaxID=2692847 RepID=UPI001681DF01|nr:hypothetical protein [Oscillatoria sp. FACHB-1407]MBD2461606.1 hypothetical protein [Oscillatoria sp. FACHB-1407]